MRHFLSFFIVITLILTACQADSSTPTGKIAELEKQMDEQPTQAGISELIGYYIQYIKEHPEDEETNGRFSYRMAGRYLQSNNSAAAITTLKDAIVKYANSTATPNNLYLLAETLRKSRPNANADLYYQALIEAYPENEYASKAKSAIKNEQPLDQRIKEVRATIEGDTSQQRVNTRLANQLIGLLQLHTSLIDDDANNPDYLYDIYNYGNAIGQHRAAMEACEELYKRYPQHEKASSAMFLAAFTAEDKLKDLDKARAIYTEFLEKHPDDPFAKSAEMSLENLGLSAEEMLEKIRQAQ